MLEQKQSGFWWTRNLNTVIYFFRELTGFIIAGYFAFFILKASADPKMAFIKTGLFINLSIVAFFAAVLHSITWLWVMSQLPPIRNKIIKTIFFALLIGLWAFVSNIILNIFYIPAI